jgi:NADPH:quinone reductase-like Zn-dependent oxidoreductase
MKAAIVRGAGQSPVYGDFDEPVAGEGEVRIAVTAASLSHLVKVRAAGTHYSSANQFPFVPGIDGIGRRDDGRRVYFFLPRAPFGSMAECTVVAASHCIAVPDGIDDVTAAAIANPGMSSSAAFAERAHLKAGETVLINGATGTSGLLAVQIARVLGAKKVIATGRNPAALQKVSALGADVTIALTQDDASLERQFREQFAEGVDVVLDYIYGKSAETLLAAAAKAGPDGVAIRFVQIGALSGPTIALPAAVLRSSSIVMMGSGLGSVSTERLLASIGGVFAAAASKGFTIAFKPVPLSQVETAWPADDSTNRTVFTLG